MVWIGEGTGVEMGCVGTRKKEKRRVERLWVVVERGYLGFVFIFSCIFILSVFTLYVTSLVLLVFGTFLPMPSGLLLSDCDLILTCDCFAFPRRVSRFFIFMETFATHNHTSLTGEHSICMTIIRAPVKKIRSKQSEHCEASK